MGESNLEKLACVLSIMELQFNIPILKIDLDEWLKENEINQSIYDTYSELSELRRAELKKLSTAVTDDSGK